MKTKIAASVLAFGAITIIGAGSASATVPSTWIKRATPTSTAVVNPWYARQPVSLARTGPVVWVKYR